MVDKGKLEGCSAGQARKVPVKFLLSSPRSKTRCKTGWEDSLTFEPERVSAEINKTTAVI